MTKFTPVLSREDALAAVRLYLTGDFSYDAIAARFSVSASTIWHVMAAKGAYSWVRQALSESDWKLLERLRRRSSSVPLSKVRRLKTLYWYHGYTQAQAARALGVSEATAHRVIKNKTRAWVEPGSGISADDAA